MCKHGLSSSPDMFTIEYEISNLCNGVIGSMLGSGPCVDPIVTRASLSPFTYMHGRTSQHASDQETWVFSLMQELLAKNPPLSLIYQDNKEVLFQPASEFLPMINEVIERLIHFSLSSSSIQSVLKSPVITKRSWLRFVIFMKSILNMLFAHRAGLQGIATQNKIHPGG